MSSAQQPVTVATARTEPVSVSSGTDTDPDEAGPAEQGWWGHHRPDETGPTLDVAEEAFPEVYTHPHFYIHDLEVDEESIATIRRARGHAGLVVTVYRSVPAEVLAAATNPETLIGPGDWVTLSRAYAAQHGLDATDPDKDWPVVSRMVRADELRTEGNSVNEWGYFPHS